MENKKILSDLSFVFDPTQKQMQILIINNEPWFVAKDVCDILGLSNAREAIRALDEDEKLTSAVLTSGQTRNMNIINESGLYTLIFQSRKPEAKTFRKWVTSVVLPTIRQTGSYEHKPRAVANPREEGTFIDACTIPFSHIMFQDRAIRTIVVNDTQYFSINDLCRAINANTGSNQIAAKLNRKQTLAQKILIFGNTHPAWFCTETGKNLIIASSRVLHAQKANRQLPILNQ